MVQDRRVKFNFLQGVLAQGLDDFFGLFNADAVGDVGEVARHTGLAGRQDKLGLGKLELPSKLGMLNVITRESVFVTFTDNWHIAGDLDVVTAIDGDSQYAIAVLGVIKYPAPNNASDLLLGGRIFSFLLPGRYGPHFYTSCSPCSKPHCNSDTVCLVPRAPILHPVAVHISSRHTGS